MEGPVESERNQKLGESASEGGEGAISCAAWVSVSAAPVQQLADEQDRGVADTKCETALSGTRT